MKKLILFVVAIAFCGAIRSQICVIDLSTQAAVDQFIIDNPTCTTIDGDVSLGLGVVDPLINVDGLQNITEITGTLSIYGSNGSDLQGLSNLTSVFGLYLSGEFSSGQLSALSNIQNVSSVFMDAYYFEDLHAFDGITSLDYLTVDFQQGNVQAPPPSFYDVFPSLTTVTTLLTIGYYDDSVCDTLTGFNSLTSVGSLNIGSTNGFYTTSFDALHNLQSVNTSLFIGEWNSESVVGFESLQSTQSIEAWTWSCTGDLPDFESLISINSIALYWVVAGSSPDFPLVTSLSENLFFQGRCPSIGFFNLQSVGGSLMFGVDTEDWLNTTPTAHFDSLQYVGGDFSINGSGLENLSFLSNLLFVGGMIQVVGNHELNQCDITYFCENIPISPMSFDIQDNSPGCNSGDDVLAACGESYAEGEVFYDLDCDGVYNNADVVVPYPIITNEFDQTVGSSNSGGHYYVPLADNSTATLAVSGLPGYTTASQTFTTSSATEDFNDVHFALCPQLELHNVSVFQYWPAPFKPGFGHIQYFAITNFGPQSEEVELTYELTNMPGITVSTITDGGMLSGNTIQWNNLSVPAFGIKIAAFYLQVSATTPIGQVFTSNISVSLVPGTLTDIFPADNFLPLNYTVVGSYDPNDISVNIPAYNHDQLTPDEGLSLDYTIRFQNTGTTEAINVRVLDVIEEDLDLSSIEMIGTSHPCVLTFNENNQLEWLFENIMLPDSTSNEEASHGFIQYRIKTQPNLLLDDLAENTAAIYFDFNEPVITNTATTVFYVCPVTPEPMADQTICEGEVVAFSGPTGWQDYSWTTFEGESSTTNQLQMMNLNVGFYEILFDASTEYCQYHDEVVVTVLSIPASPVITQSGNTLTATGSGLFHWTLNGVEISDNDSSIEITESGTYSVSVTSNGCTSPEASYNYSYTGILENSLETRISLMPNPMTHSTQLKVSGAITNAEVRITNSIGQVVLQKKMTSNTMMIHKEDLSEGVYVVSLMVGDQKVGKSIKLLVIQ